MHEISRAASRMSTSISSRDTRCETILYCKQSEAFIVSNGSRCRLASSATPPMREWDEDVENSRLSTTSEARVGRNSESSGRPLAATFRPTRD